VSELKSALNAPLFIFFQGTFNLWISGAVALGVVAIVVWIIQRGPSRQSMVWMAAMPLPWLLLGVWAGWHWAEPGSSYSHGMDGLLNGLVLGELVATLVLSSMAVVKAAPARLATAILALINGWFALLAALLSGMMVTGAWL
tara:strand:- start:116 stop:541 length:426 start_codon:yes stop_codon:yes gene_type:complete